MSEEQKEQSPSPREAWRTGPRKKRARIHLPRYAAWPVRGLWQSASEEERQQAHATGVAILSLWLGQASRQEVSERLGIPPLRVWQLSQQALSGLVAGLLRQPRNRPPKDAGALLEDAPSRLCKRAEKLAAEVEGLKRLVGLLREMPAHRGGGTNQEEAGPGSKKGTTKAGGSARVAGDWRPAPRRESEPRPAASRSAGAGGDGADGAQLDGGVAGTTEA